MSLELGNLQTMNTIALGLMMKRCGLLHKESVMKAFSHRFVGKDKVITINGKALDLGLSLLYPRSSLKYTRSQRAYKGRVHFVPCMLFTGS